MPDYKRKKVHRSSRSKASDDIKMKPAKSPRRDLSEERHIRVITGKKFANKQKFKITVVAVAIILAIGVLLSLILPVGLFENITNTVALIGTGSYPADISGTVTLNAISKGSYYYVLTNTNLTAFNNGGKRILDIPHGFYSPMLKTSETRALIYDQGGTAAYIYNLGGLVETIETEQKIITAAISRSGNYAIVTESDNYTATVVVYNEYSKKIYEWNSAKNIINNITISPNGNKIAVSTLNAQGGSFACEIVVLGYDSADPLHTINLGQEIALSLDNCASGFSLITSIGYKYIRWSNYTTKEVTSVGEIDMYRKSNNGTVLVFNRANDKSDNTVVIISNSGKKLGEFKYSGIISDIEFAKGHIYCISDTAVSLYDKKGNLVRTGSCSYGCVRFSVVGSQTLAVITDNEIEKSELDNKE